MTLFHWETIGGVVFGFDFYTKNEIDIPGEGWYLTLHLGIVRVTIERISL